MNGARVKPARALKLGDELEVRTPGALYTIHIKALSARARAGGTGGTAL